MARTSIVSSQDVSNSFDDQRTTVRVGAGGLAFLVDLAGASAGSLEIRWDFSHLDAPDVANDDHWYSPRNEAHSANGTLTGITEGRAIYDVSDRFSGTTAGQFQTNGIPTGVNWMRVAVRMDTTDSNTTTVFALHNPGPASSTAPVSAS